MQCILTKTCLHTMHVVVLAVRLKTCKSSSRGASLVYRSLSRQVIAHMDAENKALAYVLRHPPAEWAVKSLSYVRIAAHFV